MSGFGALPLNMQIWYRIRTDALHVEMRAWVSSRTEFGGGLYAVVESAFPRIASSNQRLTARQYRIAAADSAHCYLDNYIIFSDETSAVTFFFRNPFHSLWELNAGGAGKHVLQILPVLRPRGPDCNNADEGPPAASTINPGDTIVRTIEIYASDSRPIPLYFVENPYGYQQSIMMYWDELPNRDNWAVMTTADANDVRYLKYFVRLMEDHPKMKMGFLLLTDRLLTREKTVFGGWTPNAPFILADTLERIEGTYSAMMIAERDTTLSMFQTVACSGRRRFTLSYRMKTHAVRGVGAYGEVYGSTGRLLKSGTHQSGTTDWTTHSFSFAADTADTSLKVYIRLQESRGIAFFDDVRLTPENSEENLLMNGGFESVTPFIMYGNPRRHFSDAHGPEHLPTKAPAAYLSFLKSIEDGTGPYGWEGRVRLGCHGYHHTPTLYQPDIPVPGWEFQYHDSEGDGLRMESIFRDTYASGLSRASLRYWRSPGVKYTKSLVDVLVDSGFVFMDPSRKKNAGAKSHAEDYFSVFIQRGGRRMWCVKQCYWVDGDVGDNLNETTAFLSRGHVAHFGGHPEGMFPDPQEVHYRTFHAALDSLECLFPAMGYIFPDEYGDNANAVYACRILSVESDSPTVVMRLRGATRAGNTLVFEGRCSGAFFDSTALETTARGTTTAIVLPTSADTVHTIVLHDAVALSTSYSIEPYGTHAARPIVALPDNGAVRLFLSAPAVVSVDVFEMNGRRAASITCRFDRQEGYVVLRHPVLSSLPSAVYLYRIAINRSRHILTAIKH
mgnify:CR=1 FL=1